MGSTPLPDVYSSPQYPSIRRRLTVVVIVVVTAVAFLPVFGNGWVKRDDPENFLENPGYRGLGPAQLRWAFSSFQLGVYQPVAWILLGAEYEVCGLLPWGYHLASLILHCLNAAILVPLAVAILRRSRFTERMGAGDQRLLHFGAVWAAVLYAVHPLRVEAVAWASCQPYLPCTFFAMLSALAYLKRENVSGAGRVRWLAASVAMYVLALLCKAAAVTLPGALLVLDAYPLRRFSSGPRSRRRAVLAVLLEKAPFAVVGMLFFAVALGGKYVSNPSLVNEAAVGPGQRFARAVYAAGFYAEKTIWPSGLSAVYEWPERVSIFEPWFATGFVVAVCLSLLAAGLARRYPGFCAAWFAYLALLSPVSGFVRSGYAVVADRYTYLATIPLFIAFSYSLVRLWSAFQERAFFANTLTAALIAATVALGALSWRLSRSWHDAEAMVARAAEAGTLSRSTYLVELGKFHEGRLQFDEAESCFRKAVELAPNRADLADDLGGYLSRRRRLAEGVAWFNRSVQLDPGYVSGYNNLGLALALQGRVVEAARQFEAALSLQPYFVDARLNLASLLSHQGRSVEAAKHYHWVLRVDPDNRRARAGLESPEFGLDQLMNP
jgi:tetratricopeptide (TPR) repeat protein